MKTKTTFVQVINDERHTIEVPVHQVEALIKRVDMWLERNKPSKALDAIRPYVTVSLDRKLIEAAAKKAAKSTKQDIEAAIEQNRSKGKYVVMSVLEKELGLTKPQVYYYVRKAGL